MSPRIFSAAVLAASLLAGCSESTGPRGDGTPDEGEAPGPRWSLRVEALTARRSIGSPDAYVEVLPAIRVYDAENNAGLAGVPVNFTLENPAGAKTTVKVSTSSEGVAMLGEWRIGRAPGQYTATAVVEGWAPVVFTVALPGAVAAVYDLKSVDGISVPTSGQFPVREGHYVLYEGGLFNRVVNAPAGALTVDWGVYGTYRRIGNDRIEFYTEYPKLNSTGFMVTVATADLAGPEMTVGLGVYPDSWMEAYVVR